MTQNIMPLIPNKYYSKLKGKNKKDILLKVFWIYYWLFLFITLNSRIENTKMLIDLALVFSLNITVSLYFITTETSKKWSKYSTPWDELKKSNTKYKILEILINIYGTFFIGFQLYSFYYYLATSLPNVIVQNHFPLINKNGYLIINILMPFLQDFFISRRDRIVKSYYKIYQS